MKVAASGRKTKSVRRKKKSVRKIPLSMSKRNIARRKATIKKKTGKTPEEWKQTMAMNTMKKRERDIVDIMKKRERNNVYASTYAKRRKITEAAKAAAKLT